MKTCSKCGIEKDESEFVKENKSKSGYSNTCKKCRNINLKEKYLNDNNKEKQKERCRIYYLKNRETLKDINKNYRLNNKDKFKEYNKKYRLNNPIKRKETLTKYCFNNPEKIDMSWIQYRLKKKIGDTPPTELVKVKLLIIKTQRLCKTLKN
jgi:hypothetical protein